MLRHLGIIQNTGSRVIVAFMQLPEAPQKCLVIQLDTLPDYYKETINRIVQSDEGQAANDFAMVLSRHKVEGMNKDLLTVLHETRNLIPLPIDNLLMTPAPGMSFPLREVLRQMGRNVPTGQPGQADQYAEPKRFNQFEENQQADLDQNRLMIAQSKIRQAELLEADAARYRNEAYEIAPHLRPAVRHQAPITPAAPIEPAADFLPQVSAMEDIASGRETQLDLFGNNPNA